jgi:hypothetical protein
VRYKCKLCGYIYDPDVGELRSKIEAGTEFIDLLKVGKVLLVELLKTVQKDLKLLINQLF